MKKNHEVQKIVYLYEGVCTTLLAAWFTSLNWPRSISTSRIGVSGVAKLLMFALGCGTCGKAMLELDYYNATMDKHLAWIGFHGLLGVSMA